MLFNDLYFSAPLKMIFFRYKFVINIRVQNTAVVEMDLYMIFVD